MARSSPASNSRPSEPHPNAGSPERDPSGRPLAGRHAVITGASRGIGAAVALELARLGAELTIIGRSLPALRIAADRLRDRAGVRVTEAACDVTDAAAVAKLAQGLAGVSILVNNAGGAESAPFSKTDPALWRRMIDLNLTSVYAMTQH